MKRKYLASTILAARPVAYNATPSFPAALPGRVNVGFVASLIAAAKAAGDQGSITTDEDLCARDIASTWMLPYWNLVDDITTGYDAVKSAGTKYLPMFPDELSADYDYRLALTEFTNVYRDIVESLAGKPFEEEITLIVDKNDDGSETPPPTEIEDFIENVDGAGNNLTSFAAATFFNGINATIDWIYVDFPKADPSVKTKADEIAKNIRPFWSHVLGRNILEAKSEVIGGAETLVYLRILEPGFPEHVRVFERSADGVVMFSLFEKMVQPGGRSKFILIDNGVITIGVIPLVPFVTGRREGRTFKFFPAMRDAADLQIQLYQQESGLKFAKTMTAYPMLAANGIAPPKDAQGNPKKLSVGPNRVLYAPYDGQGRPGEWAYLSPDAECLKFLKDDIKETMDQLRDLGRQPLTAQSGNLTVITTAFAAGKSRSAVSAWAMRLKDTLENAMVLTCMWLNITTDKYEPQISIFDEFDDFTTDQASDLTALNNMRTARDLSQTSLWREMKRRNVLIAEFDAVQEKSALLDEAPTDPMLANEGGIDDTDPNAPKPKPGEPPKPNSNNNPAPANKPPVAKPVKKKAKQKRIA